MDISCKLEVRTAADDGVYRLFAPLRVRPMYGRFAPWTFRPLDISPHEHGAKRPRKRCRKRLKHSFFVNLFVIGL